MPARTTGSGFGELRNLAVGLLFVDVSDCSVTRVGRPALPSVDLFIYLFCGCEGVWRYSHVRAAAKHEEGFLSVVRGVQLDTDEGDHAEKDP